MKIVCLDKKINHNVDSLTVEIIKFEYKDDINALYLSCNFINNNIYFGKFLLILYDIYDLSINQFSSPFRVLGFEIQDNKEDGWETENRYSVADYEDNSFFCRCSDFEIIEIKK